MRLMCCNELGNLYLVKYVMSELNIEMRALFVSGIHYALKRIFGLEYLLYYRFKLGAL